MNNKRYPFSTQKHAHDIEFRRNRAFCDMRDIETGELEATTEEYEAICNLHDALTDLLAAVLNSRDGRVCYLTGPQIGLAKETVAWASNSRANSLIKAGKTQYLQYC